MKVILREHVEHLGERGEIVNVASGYARNYLVPKGLALAATAGNLKQVELRRKAWQVREAKEIDEFQAIADRLGKIQLKITKKAGESGTLYGSVTSTEIAELLAAKGVEIDRRRIVLADPIKETGSFEVAVKLHRKVAGRVAVEVVAEEAAE